MAQGKQLSFQYGEVSPTLRYKSDAVSYSQGLGKLHNMYVRREGGVSNRPGLQMVKKCDSQALIPSIGGAPGIRGFTFWDTNTNTWWTAEYAKYASGYGYTFSRADMLQYTGLTPLYSGTNNLEPAPDKIRFTPIKNSDVFICPEVVLAGGAVKFNEVIRKGISSFTSRSTFGMTPSLGVAPTSTMTATGTAPDLPVSYYIVGNMKDGTERLLAVGSSATMHPHASKTTKHTINLITSGSPAVLDPMYKDMKSISFYRGAGDGGLGKTFYKLVGKIPYNGTDLTVTFTDYGSDDASLTPAIDTSFFQSAGQLSGAVAAAYYQQRLILAMKPGTTDSIKAGDLVASKLGAPEQLKPPMIYSDTGAFQFSVPITDGTPVHALLAMERLIAFTGRGVYVIRGGEQGILTPTQVNPLLVSEEGCSPLVEPKMAGKRGYFINYAHTKLMAIEFGSDGNLTISEASLLSNHLLLQDVVQLEVLGGVEDMIYLLLRDGTLVSVTVNDEGVHGFATMATEQGYIESIFRGKARRPYSPNYTQELARDAFYDVLMCYVIRGGIRFLERLILRDDQYRQGEFFSDAFATAGFKFSKDGSNGWRRYISLDLVAGGFGDLGSNYQINIPAGQASYLAGSKIFINVKNPDEMPFCQSLIHYYDGGQVLMHVTGSNYTLVGGSYSWTPGTSTDPEFPIKVEVQLEHDVPESLINIKGNSSLTTVQKNYAMTNWACAYRYVQADTTLVEALGATHTNGIPMAVQADGEVISSPKNPHKPTLEATYSATGYPAVLPGTPPNGGLSGGGYFIDLGDYFCHIVYGIPYESHFETLDIETSDNRTLTDGHKLINAVGVGLYHTRGGYYGMPDKEVEDMEEIVWREEEDFAIQTPNFDGYISVSIPAEWNKTGRVAIKQVDPAPMTILSVYPKGLSSGE